MTEEVGSSGSINTPYVCQAPTNILTVLWHLDTQDPLLMGLGF